MRLLGIVLAMGLNLWAVVSSRLRQGIQAISTGQGCTLKVS